MLTTTVRRRPPLLVLVSGPPGCGKTTLATGLSAAMGLPLVSLDQVKASIGIGLAAELTPDAGPVEDLAVSARGGPAGQLAFAAAYAVMATLLEHGVSLVAEKAWVRGRAEADLRPLLAAATGVQVHVTATPSVAVSRGLARAPRRGVVDMHDIAEALEQGRMAWSDFDALELDIPLLTVETDAGPVDLGAVERFVWSALS